MNKMFDIIDLTPFYVNIEFIKLKTHILWHNIEYITL